jgi:hypothetical protein
VNDPNLPGAVVVAGISHIADAYASVAELATLPLGYIAERTDPSLPWVVSRHEWLGVRQTAKIGHPDIDICVHRALMGRQVS